MTIANQDRCTVFPASRTIIDNTLLEALDGKEHVAVVLSEADLTELIDAIGTCRATSPRIVSMFADLKRLRDGAFPTGSRR